MTDATRAPMSTGRRLWILSIGAAVATALLMVPLLVVLWAAGEKIHLMTFFGCLIGSFFVRMWDACLDKSAAWQAAWGVGHE